MRVEGPFGGLLLPAAEGARERVPAAVLELLAAARAREPAPTASERDGEPAAAVVRCRAHPAAHEVRYAAPLADARPLGALTEPGARLALLAEVGRALAALAERGEVAGDVRPEAVWSSAQGARLLAPPAGVAPGALLRARLADGLARADAAAFVAPELLAGAAPTPAADTYALAATTFWALAGRAPTGRPEVEQLPLSPPWTRAALLRALDPDPKRRPEPAQLARALTELARGARPAAAAGEGEAAPQDASAATRAAPTSYTLGCVLSLGAVFVFVGLLSCVITSWTAIGELGRLALLLAFMAGVWGTGVALERRDFKRSGFAGVVLATQLGWVVATYVLVQADAADEPGPWALAATAVSALTGWAAARRGSFLLATLSGLGSLVAAISLGAHLSTGSKYGPVGFPFFVALVLVGVAAAARRAHSRPLFLAYGVSAVVWTWTSAAAAALLLGPLVSSRHPLAADNFLVGLLWPYALAAALLALSRALSGDERRLALGGGLLLLLGAPSVQALSGAEHEALLLSPVAVYAAIQLGAARRGASFAPALGTAAAALAGLWSWGTAAYAFDRLDHAELSGELSPERWAAALLGLLWPYVAAAAPLLTAWGVTRLARGPREQGDAQGAGAAGGLRGALTGAWGIAALAAFGVLLVAPTATALLLDDTIAALLWAVALGLGLTAAAFHVPAIQGHPGRQLAVVALGLANAAAGPALLALGKCLGRDGRDLFLEALQSFGRVHETRFVYLSIVVGVSGALVLLGTLFSAHAQRKLAYRLLEVVGLLLFLGTFTLLSLPDAGHELFFAGTLLLGGGAVIALGVWQRRAMHVTIAGAALLLNLFVQYFAKLSDALHWSLLAVGFGLALLGLGIAYERHVKHLLPKLKEWA